MKTDPSIHQHHNAVLKLALTNINQYFLHARMLGHWGFKTLEGHAFRASVAVMKEADEVIARVLFLEGLPNLQNLGKLLIGEDVPEIIQHDLTAERAYRDALAAAIGHCETHKDYVSRHELEEIQEESEERIDWLETQLALIAALGLENYLQSAI
ncbi:bacterioferritin [Candidatus Thiodictyon syntrophicum]|jgi:bacterioferritin|uniref:Bacterioferritin n=1 Tax=Candidatus Thiodictyon syntrophicum TaxID=1166950 RepID=A0A2K8U5Z0_9GAMM|nr:bacterioferritin [Candidatus Thiodictyon syntrophicum]AUB81006.1 bacterioferritin [Candidatus Thiodictyon syntrophicum]